MEEVLARLRAQLRRAQPEDAGPVVLRYGELEVDLARRLVTVGGEPVHLTKTEYALLEAWGRGYGEESHYLRVYVRALRRKLGDDAAAPALILTEPGVGYRWIAERSEPSN